MRGQARDYDEWALTLNNRGWSWKEVLPLFIKVRAPIGPPAAACWPSGRADAWASAKSCPLAAGAGVLV